MKLDNGIISVEISNHGAEVKSVIKNGREYMWCADGAYWARTSPVLFPIVGSLKDKKYRVGDMEYTMNQHGFARDRDFELVESDGISATYMLKSDEETHLIYPFEFTLIIKYTLTGSSLKVQWTVKNDGDRMMSFAIGAHPGFNLKDGENYFKFDNEGEISYNLIDETGLYDANRIGTLKTQDGYVKVVNKMFDNDALIIENRQVKEVSLCDSDKKPYVTVKFTSPLMGIWTPPKKNAPFMCIEPWYGRCDRNDFTGDISERDHENNINPGEIFEAEYEIEFA